MTDHPITFGYPNVFSAHDRGLLIEDIWPTLYIGANRVDAMRERIATSDWAKLAYDQWKVEAETVLKTRPSFVGTQLGGRSAMHTNEGHHLVFDPNSASRLWDPFDSAYVEPRASGREAWGTLQHERVCRLMSSLGFLWRLTGDRRYADWVSAGLTQIRDRYDAQIARAGQDGFWFEHSPFYGCFMPLQR